MNEANIPIDVTSEALLTAENIGFSAAGKTILSDVSLQLRGKEIITLIGPIIANLAQKKWAYVRPIIVGVVIHVLATFTLVYAMNAGMFFIGII